MSQLQPWWRADSWTRSHGYIPDQSVSQPSSLHSPRFSLAVSPKPLSNSPGLTPNPKPNPHLSSTGWLTFGCYPGSPGFGNPGTVLWEDPTRCGKELESLELLFVSVFGRKQREQDFRGMGNAPLSLLKPCEGATCCFYIAAGMPGGLPQGSARNLWQVLL